MKGWIKLHRKFKGWEWWEDEKMVKFFLYLLLSANFEDKKWQGITIKRGQLVTSLKNMSAETNFSIQTIRTLIKRLKSTHELTIKTTSKYSVLTVCKYDSYQDLDTPANTVNNTPSNKRTTNEQQTINKQSTTTKECKERKELKECKEVSAPTNEKDKNLIEKIGLNQFRIFAELPAFHSLEIARKDLLIDWLQHKSKINDQYKTDYQAQSILKTFCTDYTFDELRQLVNWSTTGGRSYKNLLFDRLERVQKKSSKITANGKDNFSKYWS